jgi:hypothetical protein
VVCPDADQKALFDPLLTSELSPATTFDTPRCTPPRDANVGLAPILHHEGKKSSEVFGITC